MKKYNLSAIFLTFVVSALTLPAQAQANSDWLENTMLSSGKINVVVAVVSAVFVLLVIYLISIDRKLSRIEKNELNDTK